MNPPKLEFIEGIYVVRDDLIPGGTKQRVIPQLLMGADEFVYASPAYGYAQVALACSCKAIGKRTTIFTAKRKILHPLTRKARRAGAKIVLVSPGYLSNVQAKARQYCKFTGATYLPFGLDDAPFIKALADVAQQVDFEPDEVWTVAGSGVLIRALQIRWPKAKFFAVRIGKEPDVGRAKLFRAPEKFEEDAKIKPPFPSCSNYDAKAWRFVKQYAGKNALFWNVAG
ncbi:MAG: hypothetical protein ACE5GQ_04555 [Nitrospinales bacterium]